MNSFLIPQLGGQIYAMAGMQTQLHLIANEAGNYAGLSANFSGRGFSDMKFRAIATSSAGFDAWVKQVKASSKQLDAAVYLGVAAPSEKDQFQYFSHVDSALFNNIIAKYNNGNVRSMTGPDRDMKGM